MKKDTLLVLAIILIPIVIFGSIAVVGASNLSEEQHEGNEPSEELNTTSAVAIAASLPIVTHEFQASEPLQAIAEV